MNRKISIGWTLVWLILFSSCEVPSVPEADSCTDYSGHLVFATSETFSADLGGALNSAFSGETATGLAAADRICSLIAAEVGYCGSESFKAILSDDTENAADRLEITGAIYSGTGDNQVTVAENEADLFDGTLGEEIPYDERENEFGVDDYENWTGSDQFGAAQTGETCESWTSSSVTDSGYIGGRAANSEWIEDDQDDCADSHGLYCISQ